MTVRSKTCENITGEVGEREGGGGGRERDRERDRERERVQRRTLYYASQCSCSNLSYIRNIKITMIFHFDFIPPITSAFQLLLRVHGGEGRLGGVWFVSLTTFLTVGARVFPAVKCAAK